VSRSSYIWARWSMNPVVVFTTFLGDSPSLGMLRGSLTRMCGSLDLKLRLYNVCILSIFLHGSETWSLPAAEGKKISSLDQWCLRRICGIKWNDFVTNEEVRQRTNQVPLTSIMRRRHLGLFGQVARSDPANDTRCDLEAPTPAQWKRPPGRPRNSWLSVVSKDMKGVSIPNAMVMVEDRMHWKRVVAEHETCPRRACFLSPD